MPSTFATVSLRKSRRGGPLHEEGEEEEDGAEVEAAAAAAAASGALLPPSSVLLGGRAARAAISSDQPRLMYEVIPPPPDMAVDASARAQCPVCCLARAGQLLLPALHSQQARPGMSSMRQEESEIKEEGGTGSALAAKSRRMWDFGG